jgi:hypothetical protein
VNDELQRMWKEELQFCSEELSSLEELNRTITSLHRETELWGQGLNPKWRDYEAGTLTTRKRHSILSSYRNKQQQKDSRNAQINKIN